MARSHCRCQHPFYGMKITVLMLFTVVEFLNNTMHRVSHISFWCAVFFVPFFSLKSRYLPIYASNPAHPLELFLTDLCSTATSLDWNGPSFYFWIFNKPHLHLFVRFSFHPCTVDWYPFVPSMLSWPTLQATFLVCLHFHPFVLRRKPFSRSIQLIYSVRFEH